MSWLQAVWFSAEFFPKALLGRRVKFLTDKTPSEAKGAPILAESVGAISDVQRRAGIWEMMGNLNTEIMVKAVETLIEV